jgi:outer membrane protein assembly factor BamB
MRREIILLPLVLALAGCGIFKSTGGKKAKLSGERLAVLAYEAKTEADPELAGIAVVVPAPAANADWAQPGGNAAKSVGHLTLGTPLARAWSVQIGDGSDKTRRLVAAPVIAGGKIYTIDTRATVRAFDTRNGAALWSARIEKAGEKDIIAFGGGVSVGAGRVFATSGYGLAAAFDAATGAKVWEVDLGIPLRGAPAVSEGRIFVMTQDNQLYALSADKGETIWEATATVEAAGLLGAATPAVALGTAAVGFSSGELMALRVENGRVVWQDILSRTGSSTALAALSDIDAPPVIDQGRVFAIGHGGRMVALELATGQRVWERNLPGISMPWVAGDYIFAVTIDAELVAVTRAEGKVRWVSQLPRYRKAEKKKDPIIWRGPVLASDKLYLTNSLGQLVAASPFDGTVESVTEVADVIYLPPVVADNTLYVLSEDGRLTAFR